MITRDNGNSDYLRISDLEVGTEYSKLAYVQDVIAGNTKTNENFYTFKLKDCEANLVIGRIFNVDKFVESGVIATKLRRQPVKVVFLLQEYNGSLCLLIRSIEYYEGYFPYAQFIGVAPNAEANLQAVENAIQASLGTNLQLNKNYISDSLADVYNGKCGGYCKLLQMVIYDLISYQDLPNIDLKCLIEIFYIVQAQYYRYLKAKTKSEIVANVDKVEIILECRLEYAKHPLLKLIIDCMNGLCDITPSQHIISILIKESFEKNKRIIDLSNVYGTMILGGTKDFGGVQLVKY